MNIVDAMTWRYRQYLRPRLLLHESLLGAAARRYRNYRSAGEELPYCYVFADAGNVGDRVSSLGVQFLAGRPGLELFASPAALDHTFQMLRMLERRRPGTRVIVGGGGLLQECFVRFWSELLKTSLPFALFGVGANELAGKRKLPPADLMRSIARRAVDIHVRDGWTRDLLQAGGVEASTGICPSVNYLTARFGEQPQVERNYLLHLRHAVDVRMSGGDPERLASTARGVAEELGLRYDEADHVKESLSGLVKRYRRARFVVSSRLHGCIFSYALGIPFVAIGCDSKVAAFLGSHLPENPLLGPQVGKEELRRELLRAEALLAGRGRAAVASALSNNEAAMRRVLERFECAGGGR